MDYGEAAAVIKATISMDDILGMYDIKTNRAGFLVCPFHEDTDASLKVYRNRAGHSGWHCFGCGKGGSVIDFVMGYENIPFFLAVRSINEGLHLGLLEIENMFQRQQRQTVQRALDKIREAMDDAIREAETQTERSLRFLTRWLAVLEDIPVPDRTAEQWTRILMIQEEMQHEEYVQRRLDEIRREVIAWRNKGRSGPSLQLTS